MSELREPNEDHYEAIKDYFFDLRYEIDSVQAILHEVMSHLEDHDNGEIKLDHNLLDDIARDSKESAVAQITIVAHLRSEIMMNKLESDDDE